MIQNVDEGRSLCRLESYESRTAGLASALALLFIVAYAIPILWPGLPDGCLAMCTILNGGIWVLFVVDLTIRMRLAPNWWRYLAAHPLDVLAVALPMLRPLRVLRVFAAGQTLIARGAKVSMPRLARSVAVAAGVLVIVSALAVLDAERSVSTSNIKTLADALWWAGATVTTVGYGDRFPVTPGGRVVACALMIVGISLLGVVTAAVAAWFVARTQEAVEGETEGIESRLARIETQLAALLVMANEREDASPIAGEDSVPAQSRRRRGHLAHPD